MLHLSPIWSGRVISTSFVEISQGQVVAVTTANRNPGRCKGFTARTAVHINLRPLQWSLSAARLPIHDNPELGIQRLPLRARPATFNCGGGSLKPVLDPQSGHPLKIAQIAGE